MKKINKLLIATLCIIGLTACGGEGGESSSSSSETSGQVDWNDNDKAQMITTGLNNPLPFPSFLNGRKYMSYYDDYGDMFVFSTLENGGLNTDVESYKEILLNEENGYSLVENPKTYVGLQDFTSFRLEISKSSIQFVNIYLDDADEFCIDAYCQHKIFDTAWPEGNEFVDTLDNYKYFLRGDEVPEVRNITEISYWLTKFDGQSCIYADITSNSSSVKADYISDLEFEGYIDQSESLNPSRVDSDHVLYSYFDTKIKGDESYDYIIDVMLDKDLKESFGKYTFQIRYTFDTKYTPADWYVVGKGSFVDYREFDMRDGVEFHTIEEESTENFLYNMVFEKGDKFRIESPRHGKLEATDYFYLDEQITTTGKTFKLVEDNTGYYFEVLVAGSYNFVCDIYAVQKVMITNPEPAA